MTAFHLLSPSVNQHFCITSKPLRSTWRLHFAYPASWLILSSVMLSAHASANFDIGVFGFPSECFTHRQFPRIRGPFVRPPPAPNLVSHPLDLDCLGPDGWCRDDGPTGRSADLMCWHFTPTRSSLRRAVTLIEKAPWWWTSTVPQSPDLPSTLPEVDMVPAAGALSDPTPDLMTDVNSADEQGEWADQQSEQGEGAYQQGEPIVQHSGELMCSNFLPAPSFGTVCIPFLHIMSGPGPLCLSTPFFMTFGSQRLDHLTDSRNLDTLGPSTFPIICDTGASTSLTTDLGDFACPPVFGSWGMMQTVSGLAELQALGTVSWTVCLSDGTPFTIEMPAYYVPTAPARLFSPQEYCRYHSIDGDTYQWGGNATSFWFQFPQAPARLLCNMDPQSRLPVAWASPPPPACTPDTSGVCTNVHALRPCACAHSAILAPSNMNLSTAEKALLLDHFRLGHLNMHQIQALYSETVPETTLCSDIEGCDPKNPRRCLVPRHPQAPTVKPLPKCMACAAAKAQRRHTETTTSTPNPAKVAALTRDDLLPGAAVSMDHYESSVRGRLPNTQGREGEHRQYCGGTIFVDHASRSVSVHHQASLDASETILSKRAFELESRRCGVEVKTYHADNHVFDSKQFAIEIENRTQYIQFSGVGAHHQNGIAERAIRSVVSSARAMMLHASLHWPDEFDYNLWPFALSYAAWIHNNTPEASNKLAPSELFCGTNLECTLLRRARVWGCPTYVLDPRLQDGKKIPKWDPRSRRGQFLGFSKEHSSSIGLIRNLRTGFVTPQYHVVYDEVFSTVAADEVVLDDFAWQNLLLTGRDHALQGENLPDDQLPPLHEDWLTDAERRGPIQVGPPPLNPQAMEPDDDDEEGILRQHHLEPAIGELPPDPPPPIAAAEVPNHPPVEQGEDNSFQQGEEDEPDSDAQDAELLDHDSNSSSSSGRSGHGPDVPRNRTRRANPRYIGGDWATQAKTTVRHTFRRHSQFLSAEVKYLLGINWDSQPGPLDVIASQFASYQVANSDPYTEELGYIHPLSFQAKLNSDDPSIREILGLPPGAERDGWDHAMDTELYDLQEKGTFEFCDRSQAIGQVVPSTWVFRRKFKPDGTFSKLKARFCVRGDLQTDIEGETYAPVVDWSTLRLVFSLTVAHNLYSTQIDFKNAFVQSSLPEPIYLEAPPGRWRHDPRYAGKVLKVKKSLYGDRRAPNLWYMHLRNVLEQEGFKVSQTDPCLFLRSDCMVVCYVDDSIVVSKDPKVAQDLLNRLDQVHKMDFTREGDLAAYLGVSISTKPDGTLHLTQPALTRRIIEALGLKDSRPVPTPAVEPLGRCLEAPAPSADFNYRSVVGMLNYLANSTRLDISFAVHQCARFSANPRLPHEKALKRIGRYLQGTIENGLIIKPDAQHMGIDCYCDADFAGLWTYEDVQDPTCTRSRTGYVLTLGGTPVVWSSRLQSETALSTMEAEYIALSTSMRVLLPLRHIHLEILSSFFQQESQNVSLVSSVWEDNQGALILANASSPPRLTPRSKHIAIKYHWFREYLSPTSIQVKAIATSDQKANILTKPEPKLKFATDRLLTMGW